MCFWSTNEGWVTGDYSLIGHTGNGGTTGVAEEKSTLANSFTIEQNYPNPFNPSTTIRYGLPQRTNVTLSVFNTLGQQIAILVNGPQEAGYHDAKFDGRNLASGVYYYRLQAGSYVQTKQLLLLR
jgi:hypothetical protein